MMLFSQIGIFGTISNVRVFIIQTLVNGPIMLIAVRIAQRMRQGHERRGTPQGAPPRWTIAQGRIPREIQLQRECKHHIPPYIGCVTQSKENIHIIPKPGGNAHRNKKCIQKHTV